MLHKPDFRSLAGLGKTLKLLAFLNFSGFMKLIYNHKFLGHKCQKEHPESPERLKYFSGEKETRIMNGEQYLSLAHDKAYINLVKEYSAKGLWLSEDTFLEKDSFETACYAVGAAVQAAESKGFALVRPPGHHAGIAKGHGFCLFNNMAIAAKYLLKKKKRVFVFDFDLHHGDGTQEILENEKDAFYFSTHQIDIFPFTGMANGKNFINVPMRAGSRDVEFIGVLERKLLPAIEKFKPDVIGLSAGFDCYFKDFSENGSLYSNGEEPPAETPEERSAENALGFFFTKRSFKRLKELLAPYNCFAVLEGGYNPESVFEGVKEFLD